MYEFWREFDFYNGDTYGRGSQSRFRFTMISLFLTRNPAWWVDLVHLNCRNSKLHATEPHKICADDSPRKCMRYKFMVATS